MTMFKPTFDSEKLVGKRFGKLTVVKYSHKITEPKRTTYFWECLCDCGKTTKVRTGHLNNGSIVSCGCHRTFLNRNKGRTKEDFIKLISEIKPNENGCVIWPYTLNDKGYGKTTFKNKTCEAHRVLYRCVHGKIENGMVIRHLCNNKACVNIDHLAIGTKKDNSNDMIEAGTRLSGEKHPMAKLTKEQVKYIRENEMHVGSSKLGRKYNVCHSTIYNIKKRKIWKHI